MIRVANLEKDSKAIAEIYAYYVKNTWISFETEAPSKEEMEKRISSCLQVHPWLVYVENDEVLGYCYGGQHRNRKAYQWSAECSVYLRHDCKLRGVGSELYEALFGIMKKQGFKSLYAGISLPNKISESFHLKMGFRPVGTYHKVGYKFESWFDVMWLELEIMSDENFQSLAPIPFAQLKSYH